MQPLSPTLLAAQRALGGVPSVRVRVEDHELRWAPVIDSIASTCQTAGCAAAGGIVRARIRPEGGLDVQRIARPHLPGEWLAWTALAADADPASDVALSALDGDPARLRLFYARSGGSPCRLSYLQSGDGGATWSAPADYLAGLAAPGALASANAQLLYHDPADGLLKLATTSAWQGGVWTARPWAEAGALAARYGVAAGYAAGVYYVASADEEAPDVRRLRSGTCEEASGAWSAPEAVVPPGLPSASFVPRYPSLAHDGDLWHLGYLETLSGALAYAEPTIIHSADWAHWSFACWVPLQGFGAAKRAVLVACSGALYLALESAVWRAVAYSPLHAAQHLEEDAVAGYLVEEEPGSGRTLVELYSPQDRYAGLSAPLEPLATVVVERGFRTEAGEERVARPPCYIVSAAVRRGGQRPTLQLECEDGWGLLRRWQPDALYLWRGRTVAWLIAEILCRATGLACHDDGLSPWSTVLDAFAVAPANWADILSDTRRAWLSRELRAAPRPSLAAGSSGLGVLRALLAKVGGAARWQPDGSLYCFIPSAQALAVAYTIGAGGEIRDALYGRGLMAPTQARVFGSGAAAVAAAPGARGAPRRSVATYVDPHLTSDAGCANRASGLVYDGQARGYLGWVETPCHCGLELCDLVTVEDAHAGALAGACLRVAGIVERYDPAAGAFYTRTTLERA